MRLLLDTQVIYLWMTDDAALPPRAIAALSDSRNQTSVSAASFWEIAIKHAKGKLDWPTDGFQTLLDSEFRKLPISPAHAIAAGRLPAHHTDPFDRLLVAQATAEAMTLIGSDPMFGRYGIDVLWS